MISVCGTSTFDASQLHPIHWAVARHGAAGVGEEATKPYRLAKPSRLCNQGSSPRAIFRSRWKKCSSPQGMQVRGCAFSPHLTSIRLPRSDTSRLRDLTQTDRARSHGALTPWCTRTCRIPVGHSLQRVDWEESCSQGCRRTSAETRLMVLAVTS